MRHRARAVPRIGAYIRARLRRRIFWWFGATIALTGAVVFVTMSSFGQGPQSFRREVERGRTLLAHVFERAWSRPDERDALARTIAADLDADLTLEDAAHAPLLTVGRPCKKAALQTPVVSGGAVVGHVSVCPSRARQHGGWRAVLSVVAAGLVLWAISGRIARRLARPFDQLTLIADELGRGRLNARLDLPCRAPGEVAIVARVLNDMAARIERQIADQRELLAAVSHEIRTPIARIRILTELGRDGADAQKTFDEIDREIVEIDALVSELLASARLDFAALKPSKVDVVDISKRALERAGLDADRLLVEGATHVTADPTLLARALANLLENAQRHGGGADRLCVRGGEATVRFDVEDRGPGIPPGDEEKIFESFHQRAGEEAREKGSLGLGLALVRRIAEAHGGRVRAENREGGGARVGLELPL